MVSDGGGHLVASCIKRWDNGTKYYMYFVTCKAEHGKTFKWEFFIGIPGDPVLKVLQALHVIGRYLSLTIVLFCCHPISCFRGRDYKRRGLYTLHRHDSWLFLPGSWSTAKMNSWCLSESMWTLSSWKRLQEISSAEIQNRLKKKMKTIIYGKNMAIVYDKQCFSKLRLGFRCPLKVLRWW